MIDGCWWAAEAGLGPVRSDFFKVCEGEPVAVVEGTLLIGSGSVLFLWREKKAFGVGEVNEGMAADGGDDPLLFELPLLAERNEKTMASHGNLAT